MTESKIKNVTPMMEQYLQIKQENPGYLIFYRLGDFYELFFDDALTASKVLDIALTKRGKDENGINIPMCGVPFHAYESYMAKLIRNGYKVAICEQVEDPKEAKKRGYKAVVKREVVRLVTQGTLTEDNLLPAKYNNYICSICKMQEHIGVAWIDLSTGLFFTQDFDTGENPETYIISSTLTRLSPAEILIADEYLRQPQFFEVFNEYKEKLSVIPANRFNSISSLKTIQHYFDVQTITSFGDFTKAEISAAGTLLDYIERTQVGKIPLIETPHRIQTGKTMEIDSATRKNLEILESCSSKNSSLLKAIDYTMTGTGGRMLSRRLVSPLTDIKEINNRLDIVEFFINNANSRDDLRAIFKDMPEIERSLSRICLGRGGPRDLKGLALALQQIPRIRNAVYFSGYTQEMPEALRICLDTLGNYSNLTTKILDALREESEDFQLPFLARDGGFIRDGYSPALDMIRTAKKGNTSGIAALQAKYIKETGISGLKIKYNSIIGYFVEIPNKNAEDLLNNPNFIYRQSVLNAVRYTTMELTEIDRNISSASEKSIALEQEIFDGLRQDVKIVSDDIFKTAKALAEIDIACGFATIAVERNYCRPIIDNSEAFEIEEGRHPVVEKALADEHAGEFIANNCCLDAKDDAVWLLTGPNMAGKSTFLRQNAIIAVMAQIGSYVPCKYARIGVINKLFSRVGASDDLARGHSTFMIEMLETARILHQADEHSFVILDEIGRGTATFDGLSIAWAVIEHLHNVNRCRAIFATHYHELTSLSQKLPHSSLHCMKIKEFNGEVIFMHEVMRGSADRSYGIHVAKLAGLPSSVINRASQVLKSLENSKNSKNIVAKAEELPLFAIMEEKNNKNHEEASKLEKAVKDLNPDDYSPREALEKLYELKQLIEEE